MNKKLFAVLLLFLFLCACAKEEPVPETAADTIAAPAETAQQVSAATAPTVPLHCEYYHPDYTARQIWTYFEEVILHVEYTNGTGDATLVQKWTQPIRFRFFGTPTQEDLAVLNALFAQLNRIHGFPGIREAAEGETEQLRISFLEPEVFRASYASVVGGEDAVGATEFWYDTDTNEIYSARIGYRTDLDQQTRNSILPEEIVNTLGISDTVLREDSITYQYSNDNLVLSDVDRILLALLYHPDIRCGMDAEDCAAVIGRLYY